VWTVWLTGMILDLPLDFRPSIYIFKYHGNP
jgi:hypothetical protein